MLQTAVRVQLRLDRSLRLCGENETDTDCCSNPLCVLETLQVSACRGGTPQASLLIQAKIHALLVPANAASGHSSETYLIIMGHHRECLIFNNLIILLSISDNKTVIPNQVYQPLGSCPCDLTFRACDVRCCCDKVFTSHTILHSFNKRTVYFTQMYFHL